MREFKTELRDLVSIAIKCREHRTDQLWADVDNGEQEMVHRYELAQRARARNLVGQLRALCSAALWSRNDYFATREHQELAGVRARRLHLRADRIAAKYLGEKSRARDTNAQHAVSCLIVDTTGTSAQKQNRQSKT